MSTSYNFKSTNCSIPLLVPKDCRVFAEQSLFTVLSSLSSACANWNGLASMSDIRAAIRFVSRLSVICRSDDELHSAGIFVYDADEEDEDEV